MKGFGEYSKKTKPLGRHNHMNFEKWRYIETIDKKSRLNKRVTYYLF